MTADSRNGATPGPWPEPEYNNDGEFLEWWEISDIATVYREQDASLIAAAPELLAVLKDVERAVMVALSGETNASQCRVYSALKPVRAVLAKIEGRA